MSNERAPLDLEKLRQRWILDHQPIPQKDSYHWERDWSSSLKRLPYLKFISSSQPLKLENIVQLRVELNLRQKSAEMAHLDIKRIWNEISSDLNSFHALEETPTGFKFMYAALDKNECYFTGTMHVQLQD